MLCDSAVAVVVMAAVVAGVVVVTVVVCGAVVVTVVVVGLVASVVCTVVTDTVVFSVAEVSRIVVDSAGADVLSFSASSGADVTAEIFSVCISEVIIGLSSLSLLRFRGRRLKAYTPPTVAAARIATSITGKTMCFYL